MKLDAWFSEANTLIAAQASLPLISRNSLVMFQELHRAWHEVWSYRTAPPIPPHDPNKLNERFAVLNFLYCLAHFGLDEHPDEITEIQQVVGPSLGEAVRLLEVDECIGECRVLRWEVINSCLIADWVRAEALLARLAKAEGWGDGTSAKVSARLHLQSVWAENDPEWPGEWWSPAPEPDVILTFSIYTNAVAIEPLFGNQDIKNPKELTPSQLRRVNLAVTGFERAKTRDVPLTARGENGPDRHV